MSKLSSLSNQGTSLGSLAQSARKKHLKQAQWTLIIIGALTLILNGAMFVNSANEVRQLAAAHPITPEQEVTILGIVRMIYGGAAALGLAFLILGILVPKFPVPTTIAGLVLYIGSTAVFALINPASLASGAIIKVFITVGLVKAIQAALAYQKESAQLDHIKPSAVGLGADL